ncbi:hypothetical protein GCM10022253_15960 [Sphingomonas endophytica]|uniref:Flagellar assembly protein FliH n=1 Tax=Sphingomonas endophytica TaxID=869719 RepID=A0ABR6N4C6_9SPHN|nr:FliH/SctL family protein [Sphingomonas endophytica]MBB5725638.1 flagellar assembly protein FliH [Sphingomonas endophytica]
MTRPQPGRVEPFGFDRVFHPGKAVPEPADAERSTQARALAEQLAQAEEAQASALAAAHAEGFRAGMDEGRREGAAALLSATDAIHAALDDLDVRFVAVAAQQTRMAAEAALAAAEVLAGHAVAAAPLRAIEEALTRALAQVSRGTHLAVYVHPALYPELVIALEARQQLDRRQLHVTPLADPSVAEGDARIVWDEGGLMVDAAARRAIVIDELRPLLPDLAP